MNYFDRKCHFKNFKTNKNPKTIRMLIIGGKEKIKC